MVNSEDSHLVRLDRRELLYGFAGVFGGLSSGCIGHSRSRESDSEYLFAPGLVYLNTAALGPTTRLVLERTLQAWNQLESRAPNDQLPQPGFGSCVPAVNCQYSRRLRHLPDASNVRMNAPASVIGAPSLTSVVHHSTAVRFPTLMGVPYRISMFDCVAVTRAQYSRTAAGPASAS